MNESPPSLALRRMRPVSIWKSAPPAWAEYLAIWVGIVALSALMGFLAYSWSEHDKFVRLDDNIQQQLNLYHGVLEGELGKHAYLPSLFEQDPDVAALVAAPERTGLRDTVNRKLANVNVRAGSVAIFVMNAAGTVLASSDGYRPQSMIGRNLSGHSYFADAMKGFHSRSFGADPLRGAPEYYFAQPLQRNGAITGVVAVKISLEPLESTWVASSLRSGSEKLLVVDDNDVVILSSVPAWRYRTLSPRGKLADVGRYPAGTVEPLGIVAEQTLKHGAQLVRLPDTGAGAEVRYFSQSLAVSRAGWRLLILADASDVWQTARLAAVGAGAVTAFLSLFVFYLLQQRRVRRALQRAHDELERKVEERTVELRDANRELRHEIQERLRAEEVLREAQDELVQAGKLALLGQLSASISHEIDQPLTALRALAKNTPMLLARDRAGEVEENMKSIAGLAERMGRITAQLKSFARKAPPEIGFASLAAAVANARLLLDRRMHAEHVEMRVELPDAAQVRCDATRLEQVLVNLFANALDAMKESPVKVLGMRAWPVNGRLIVRVSDTGTGIPDDIRQRLFEPFFSTKRRGEGLGLGLVISRHIIREFGGELRAMNVDDGAAFEFDLKLPEGGGDV